MRVSGFPLLMACALLLCGLLAATPAGAGTSPSPDPLWDLAVAIVAANDGWTAGTILFVATETNGKGEARRTSEITVRSVADEHGGARQEVVRYVENGRDLTEQKRGEQSADGSRGQQSSWNLSDPRQTPFHPATQPEVTFRRLDARRSIAGRECVGFAYEQGSGARERTVGTAWLEAQTGAPLAIEAAPDPLPPLVQRARMEVRFEYTPEGAWYPTRFVAEGTAVILFVKRGFSMDLTFTDHWRTAGESP